MGAATRTIDEMRDIINDDMRDIYERSEGEDDIREVLELEGAMEMECERRDADARALIRGEHKSTHTHTYLCMRTVWLRQEWV